MTEVHEHAEHAEHISHSNKQVALVIAVLALFLSFSETLGKSTQTEAIAANIKASDLWSFFQAKTIRRTVLNAASDEMAVTLSGVTNAATKDAMQKQIDTWKKTSARYQSEPETHEGTEQLSERAKEAEKERDHLLAKYHHYELASAAFQIGIVLASASVITGMLILAWAGGALGALGLVIMLLGVIAPHAIHLG